MTCFTGHSSFYAHLRPVLWLFVDVFALILLTYHTIKLIFTNIRIHLFYYFTFFSRKHVNKLNSVALNSAVAWRPILTNSRATNNVKNDPTFRSTPVR